MDLGEVISLIGVLVAIISIILQHFWTRNKFNALNISSNNKMNIQTGNKNQNEQ